MNPWNFETLRVVQEARVAWVYLSRPDARNAFDARMIQELAECFKALAAKDEVQAVVLTGDGKAFCAGADIGWMKQSASYTAEENRADAGKMIDMFQAIDECPKLVIARVNGHCLGGGMGLIACCDSVVSIDKAKFGFTEVRLGIVPAVISNFCLPKIGKSWARKLFTTGEIFEADRCKDIGLVHDVVDSPEALDAVVDKVLEDAFIAGPNARGEAKALVGKFLEAAHDKRRDLTLDTISRLRVGDEAQEGFKAFFEKREAAWRG